MLTSLLSYFKDMLRGGRVSMFSGGSPAIGSENNNQRPVRDRAALLLLQILMKCDYIL